MSASTASDAGSAKATLEGVVILGMHRSGTSLVTRLVNLLGVEVCRHDDLLVGRPRNPRGHWESKSLLRFNDQLLAQLGGSWFCPPLLGPDECSRLLREHGADALAALQRAHPQRPWVWKDPRTCVLLPFWAAVLDRRAAYVLVVRHPFEVSDSLAHRNGCTRPFSLALWERYTRQAMLGAAGRPTMICTYDAVLNDPAAWCKRLAGFLGEMGLDTHPVDQLAVDAFVMDELRHSSESWNDLCADGQISAEQVELASAASTFTAQRAYVPPPLPDETPQTATIFNQIADMRPRARSLSALPAQLVVSAVRTAEREQDGGPPLSVVLAAGGSHVQATIAALGETLPQGSELLAGPAESPEVERPERPLSQAATLALRAGAAKGRLLLLCAGALNRCDPWYEAFGRALDEPLAGGVGPVMRFASSPRTRHFGRAFADEDLTCRAVAGRPAQALEPAALLSSNFCVFDRGLLAVAGGLDPGFESASAAVAELSVRLWRMGYRCRIVSQVEVWVQTPEEDSAAAEADRAYDRLRIATLHLGAARLQLFTEHAQALPGYQAAAERLARSDVRHRRAAIDAVCASPVERYFERFPLMGVGGGDELAEFRRSKGRPLARLLKRARLR